MTNVLVSSAGQRVSLVRVFQEELRRLDAEGKVLTCDLDPAMSPACQVSDGAFRVPHTTAPDFSERLLDRCVAHEIGLVVPTIDTELLALARARDCFAQRGVHVVVSSPDLVRICRDKRRTNEFFASRDIDTPAPIAKDDPTFPLFIKPHDGSLSADTFVIRSASELLDRHRSEERLMFMEYLDADNYDEYTVDLYYDRGHRLRCVVPRRRLKVRAGEVNKAITSRNAIVPFLNEKLATVDGARGCLTAQFFVGRTSGRIVGIEINARFGGGYPLTYHAGANYPRWLLEEYLLDREVPPYDDWRDELLMLRYDQELILDAPAAGS